jgi:predicted PurR-regulated permease PerM
MDTTLIKADVFFFVTTIAVVLATVLGCVVLAYVIMILRDIRAIVARAKAEATAVIDDIADLREGIHEVIDDGIAVSKAATRAMRPGRLSQTLRSVISTILSSAGSSDDAPPRRRRKTTKQAREDYESN